MKDPPGRTPSPFSLSLLIPFPKSQAHMTSLFPQQHHDHARAHSVPLLTNLSMSKPKSANTNRQT